MFLNDYNFRALLKVEKKTYRIKKNNCCVKTNDKQSIEYRLRKKNVDREKNETAPRNCYLNRLCPYQYWIKEGDALNRSVWRISSTQRKRQFRCYIATKQRHRFVIHDRCTYLLSCVFWCLYRFWMKTNEKLNGERQLMPNVCVCSLCVCINHPILLSSACQAPAKNNRANPQIWKCIIVLSLSLLLAVAVVLFAADVVYLYFYFSLA